MKKKQALALLLVLVLVVALALGGCGKTDTSTNTSNTSGASESVSTDKTTETEENNAEEIVIANDMQNSDVYSKYKQLKIGMSEDEIVAIMGSEGEKFETVFYVGESEEPGFFMDWDFEENSISYHISVNVISELLSSYDINAEKSNKSNTDISYDDFIGLALGSSYEDFISLIGDENLINEVHTTGSFDENNMEKEYNLYTVSSELASRMVFDYEVMNQGTVATLLSKSLDEIKDQSLFSDSRIDLATAKNIQHRMSYQEFTDAVGVEGVLTGVSNYIESYSYMIVGDDTTIITLTFGIGYDDESDSNGLFAVPEELYDIWPHIS